jgi:hypothetical protein
VTLYPAGKAFSPIRSRNWRDYKPIAWKRELQWYITVKLYLYRQLFLTINASRLVAKVGEFGIGSKSSLQIVVVVVIATPFISLVFVGRRPKTEAASASASRSAAAFQYHALRRRKKTEAALHLAAPSHSPAVSHHHSLRRRKKTEAVVAQALASHFLRGGPEFRGRCATTPVRALATEMPTSASVGSGCSSYYVAAASTRSLLIFYPMWTRVSTLLQH